MFDVHFDALYAWIGVALVSVAAAGVVATLPAAPPPDATGTAHTIDSVADGEYPATAEHGLSADRVRLTAGSVSLANGEDVSQARIHAPQITPAPTTAPSVDGRLHRVLAGVSPDRVFDDPATFETVAADARAMEATWHIAPNRLTVRRVHYGGVHVTLVG